jgi:hypothetical protein
MEMSKSNSLCRYLMQITMSFLTNREKEGKTNPVWVFGYQWEGTGCRERV